MTSTWLRRWTLVSAVACLGLFAADVFGQAKGKEAPLPKFKYKFNTPNATLRTNSGQLGSTTQQVQKVLRGDTPLADMPNFDRFFTEYYFPMMTLDDASLASEKTSVTTLRTRFFRDYLNSNAAPTTHAHLAGLTLTEMQKIVKDDYHPAARYNAMLIIGLLNDSELVRTGENKDKAGPSPHPRALPPMLEIYKAADSPDLVRLAALLGFVRHLEWDPWRSPDRRIAAATKKEIVDILLALANTKEPPADRTAEGHEWMRRKAIEGLGFAITTKADPAIVAVLDKVMDDEKDTAEVRTTAAAAFGRGNFTGMPTPVAPAVERLAKVTEAVFESELHRLTDQRKREAAQVGIVGPSAGGAGIGGPPPGVRGEMMRGPGDYNTVTPDDPHYYRVEYSRRKVRAGLHGIEGALNGVDDRPNMNNPRTWEKDRAASGEVRGLTLLAAARPAAQQKADKDAVDKLKKEIDRLVKIIENETADLDRESYEEALKTAAAEASQFIGGPPPATAPAQPGAPAAQPGAPANQAAPADFSE